jgi:hypothetical protein
MTCLTRMTRLFWLVAVAGCTNSELVLPAEPRTCGTFGGEVDGQLTAPKGLMMLSFGPVQVTSSADQEVTLTDVTQLSLVLSLGNPPRSAALAFLTFPDPSTMLPTTVYGTNGKIAIDEDDATCLAGRFDLYYQYHGEISGWFAVMPPPPTP